MSKDRDSELTRIDPGCPYANEYDYCPGCGGDLTPDHACPT